MFDILQLIESAKKKKSVDLGKNRVVHSTIYMIKPRLLNNLVLSYYHIQVTFNVFV